MGGHHFIFALFIFFPFVMEKAEKHDKILKKMISTSKRREMHQFASQNTQHLEMDQ